MRAELLFAVFACHACLAQPVEVVYPYIGLDFGNGYNTCSMSAAAHRVSFRVPADIGSFGGLIVRFGTVTAGGDADMCIYEASSAGTPSGSPIHCQTFSVSTAWSNSWRYLQYTSPPTLPDATINYAAVLEFSSYSGQNWVVTRGTNAAAANSWAVAAWGDCYNGTTWNSSASANAVFVDGSGKPYPRMQHPELYWGGGGISSSTNPSEVGVKCRWPYDVRILGLAVHRDPQYRGTGPFELRLYDGDTVLRTVSNAGGGSWTGKHISTGYFTEPYYAAAGTYLIAAFRPTTTTQSAVFFSIYSMPSPFNDVRLLIPTLQGLDCVGVRRVGSNAWIEDAAQVPAAAFVLEVVK